MSGTGKWELQKSSGYWQVRLFFRELPGYPRGYGTAALVAGSRNSIQLFQWIDEEGGKRYVFKR